MTKPAINIEEFNSEINKWLDKNKIFANKLWEDLTYLRNKKLKKRKYERIQKLDIPIATFSKPERLKSGMGIEITMIMLSSACSWARSNSGGCTMCGYWNDRGPESLSDNNYWNQLLFALDKYQEILKDLSNKIVFKIFTSGSFCDSHELSKEIQLKILSKLAEFATIKEIVIESRPEYITESLLTEYQKILPTQYLEIGIGLETSNDFIRKNIINKGFNWNYFVKSKDLLHTYNFGVKAYLLFKPPFLSEYTALQDIFTSVRKCIDIGVDTISINPLNIQNNTLCNELDKIKGIRTPWLYSILWLLKNSITNEELKKTRIICDPSAAGKERGVHNFAPIHPSNKACLKILHNFVELQDISVISDTYEVKSWNSYLAEIFLDYL